MPGAKLRTTCVSRDALERLEVLLSRTDAWRALRILPMEPDDEDAIEREEDVLDGRRTMESTLRQIRMLAKQRAGEISADR